MPMSNRQKAYADEAELREDAVLFKGGIIRTVVEVTAQRRRTAKGDLILRGFIRGKEIDVVFPGRRVAAAAPLLLRLQQHANARAKGADNAGKLPETVEIRHKIRIDGSWRVRLLPEGEDGMPVRRFQLLAARWRHAGGSFESQC